ncbi:MAG: beta-lactamase family protein [Proteobacteria bacterium]|nr:beta-lactamase family protein [Pseudomonadota bacterium]
MTRRIDSAFRHAISDGVFPAADVLVAKEGEVLYSGRFGLARECTCFDIASLTKPIATATLTMMLAADGLLKLDDTVYQWLPGARQSAHRQMTVAHLMDHVSGLPAWQPFYRVIPMSLIGTEEGRSMILEDCYAEEPVAEPGSNTIYSDIGYILLGEILHHAAGEPLDRLFAKRIAEPLGLADTFFVRVSGEMPTSSRRTKTRADQHVPTPKYGAPDERPVRRPGEHRRFAPTEDCPWRERVVHGEVHDQNAFALGGVAGHAGLFSTAEDIHRFALDLVRCYRGESRWFDPEMLRQFIKEGKRKPAGEQFVAGWNRPSLRNSASGHRFSANSIGHLGYTGCSIWIDLSRYYWIVLLTNRIHPTSTNQMITAFRPAIHDLIYDELIA